MQLLVNVQQLEKRASVATPESNRLASISLYVCLDLLRLSEQALALALADQRVACAPRELSAADAGEQQRRPFSGHTNVLRNSTAIACACARSRTYLASDAKIS